MNIDFNKVDDGFILIAYTVVGLSLLAGWIAFCTWQPLLDGLWAMTLFFSPLIAASVYLVYRHLTWYRAQR